MTFAPINNEFTGYPSNKFDVNALALLTLTPRLKILLAHPDAKVPEKARGSDLGYDLFALEKTYLIPGKVTKVRTGIKIGFPNTIGGLLRDRSSMATKAEVFVVAGVIDPEYTGEIIVALFNPNADIGGTYVVEKGDKIAQMILIPSITVPTQVVETLEETSRGEQGFGSTGR
jgi:dUTP pyrophosphatase